jgi:hypothetical protein
MEMQMYSWQNMRDIMSAEKFDPIIFKNQFHEEFMFIRETSLVDRDQFCAEIDELMSQGKNSIPHEAMELIHENDDCTEIRWVDGNERIVRINLKKDGLIWRSIVKRTPINN